MSQEASEGCLQREEERAGGLKADIQASGKFYENMIELFSHFI
jgi:hypothetical protein